MRALTEAITRRTSCFHRVLVNACRIVAVIYRDSIQALSGQPQFSIRKAKDLADEAKRLYSRQGLDSASPDVLHIDRALGTAYLQHHNLKKAAEIFEPHLRTLNALNQLTPLDRAMFLKTYARYRKSAGDHVEWEYFIRRALQIDIEEGFAQQVSEIQKEYGGAVAPIIEELWSGEDQRDALP